VEKFNFITIAQAKNMFYPSAFGYDTARRRLSKLCDSKYLKCVWNDDTKEKIFMRDNYNRKVSLHAMLLMNYYCKLVSSGARIEKFEREKEWADGKIRSDAFVVFKIGRNFGDEKEATIRQIVEVHVSHNHPNLERYEWLWDTQEVQRECNYEADRFPDIVLIDDINHIKPFVFPRIRIIHLDFKLDEFTKVFL
jgi:hypothetical protein